MAKNSCVVSIPVFEKVKICFSSLIFGMWFVCILMVKWIWDRKSFSTIEQRDNPPSCLVDSHLGQHKYVKLKGVKFHYVENGPRNAPLVLLLHGFPDCWLSWRYQIPLLSNHFRVIALDLKGYGDSDKPTHRNAYRIDLILEEVRLLILTLGVVSCTVIGHGIGGAIAWFLAQNCPEVIDRLVLVAAPHPNIYRRRLDTCDRRRWLFFVQYPHLPEIDALKEDVHFVNEFHSHLPKNDPHIDAYKYSFSRKEDWTGALNYFRTMLFYEVASGAEPVQIPTLLVAGAKDTFTPLESVVRSSEFCERPHVKIIDDVGHFPHQERPDAFNSALMHFLIRKRLSEIVSRNELTSTKGIMNRMFGAVTSTVKYGNIVLDTVQKRTNGVVGGLPAIAASLSLGGNSKNDKG